jgi:DNA polymerase III subunit alpha
VVQQVWSLEQARCRFGKFLRVAVQLDPQQRPPDLAALLREFPAEREMSEQGELVRGLSVRLQVQCLNPGGEPAGAAVDLHLDDKAKFFPSDAALASWRGQAYQGKAAIVYDL